MSSRDRNVDIKEFLANINLVQYLPYFKEAGYNTVLDCIEINNNVLQQIGISLTGHRKRILKQLEITFSKMQEKSISSENVKLKDLEELGESHSLCYAQVSKISNLSSSGIAKASPVSLALPARLFSKEKSEFTEHELLEVKDGSFSDFESSSSSYQKSDCSGYAVGLSGNIEKSANFQNIPNMDVALEKAQAQQGNLHLDSHSALYVEDPTSRSSFADSSETKSSENEHLAFSEVEISPNVLPDSPFFEFKGEMVDNDLYGPCKQSCTKVVPRTTRSFMLRHRPVPEIPGSSKIAASPSEEKPSVISPYGETFLFNSPADAKEICGNEFLAFEEKMEDKEVTEEHCLHDKSRVFNIQIGKASSEDRVKNELISQEDKFMLPEQLASESEYTTVEECSPYLRTKKHKAKKYSSFPSTNRSRNLEHSVKQSIYFPSFGDNQTITSNDSITPYACFYGSSLKKVKAGWLDKLSPQGKRMFQKRWVKFDGDSISYYNNDKEIYSKGIILLSAIATVRIHGENKFEVVTAHRTFVFRVEKEDERIDWINTMLSALKSQSNTSQTRPAVTPEKSGYLELKGYKAKIFTLLLGNNVWLCKNEKDFKTGFGITIIPMNVANVKQVDRTAKQSFEIITPYKSFSFTAESEGEKQEWIEALQQSIAETLSDYEVAEKIWFNESNRSCADCKAPDPDWASINLCVVICKKCAGQHRSLGPRDSKVRSLKMDASIWSNELIELFIVIGNKRANSFWAGKLQPEEELHMDSSLEKRITFITQKYKEGRFRKTPLGYKTKEELNKALCAAVVKQDVLETMTLLFSGADVMCATGDPVYSTPYLLAKKAGQRLQMEFLYHNKFSDFPNYDTGFESGFTQDASHSTFLCEFLYKVSYNAAKLFTDRKLKEDCNKRWCTLESGFLSYYENDKTTTPSGMIDISEVICLVVHKEDSFLNTGTLYIHGHTKLDFTVWHTAIEKAARTDGNALQDQQLGKNDVPITVNSCIAFVTQYGLGSKHIYLKNGDPSHVSELLESFKKDARSVKLRAGTHQLEDVTDVLKCFLSQIDDALLTKELYPFWISALDTQNEKERVKKYGTFIQSLPPVNRATLAALIEHLYRRISHCGEVHYLLIVPQLYPRKEGTSSPQISHGGPKQGNIPVRWPDSARSAPPAAKSDAGAGESTPTDPMAGSCWKARKHSHKQETKSSYLEFPCPLGPSVSREISPPLGESTAGRSLSPNPSVEYISPPMALTLPPLALESAFSSSGDSEPSNELLSPYPILAGLGPTSTSSNFELLLPHAMGALVTTYQPLLLAYSPYRVNPIARETPLASPLRGCSDLLPDMIEEEEHFAPDLVVPLEPARLPSIIPG
ncbi:Arf-GAP with Rho-GAP domain, ANK repeat and PH domain-containing protein 2 [Chelonia mydas]|uniref:Arf-GAP with Rho-GAP domain, ANK repeat and PH domain-containing protein 2 n=1 Tax=Chelonia mydas TaxID=8469 RepID=M7BFC1_CHEMY|nr:Arf-GAP with Rho-GAP domain, ANK repeat and PH domain-containing protein 2 [Chelonia mydas]